MCRIFAPGIMAQHFKRETISDFERAKNKHLYRIVGTAIHYETRERMIYQALYATRSI